MISRTVAPRLFRRMAPLRQTRNFAACSPETAYSHATRTPVLASVAVRLVGAGGGVRSESPSATGLGWALAPQRVAVTV